MFNITEWVIENIGKPTLSPIKNFLLKFPQQFNLIPLAIISLVLGYILSKIFGKAFQFILFIILSFLIFFTMKYLLLGI